MGVTFTLVATSTSIARATNIYCAMSVSQCPSRNASLKSIHFVSPVPSFASSRARYAYEAGPFLQRRKTMGWVQEFRDFINRGNVIDLAVGLVIGAAFTGIVNSLVNDMIMPIIGVITGGIDFTGLNVTAGEAVVNYGNFIQAIINFLIIAFSVFWLVKAVNRFRKKEEAKAAEPAAPTTEERLLTEIRDLLQARQGTV
jgi:large conductance mechanosensitive channel